MKIILIGKMGAGKNTVGLYLARRYGFIQMAFADKLKEIARDLFPEAFERGKPRALLQQLGLKMREINEECWTNYVIRQVARLPKNYDFSVVITDCRYKNELEIARKHGFIPVLVSCPDEIRIQRLYERDGQVDLETLNHVSETELDGISVEHELVNSGTREELHSAIDSLVKSLRPKRNSWEL